MMKGIIIAIAVLFSGSLHAQKFTKISDKKVDQERLSIAKTFAQTYLDKCENQDFSGFSGFNISEKLKNYLTEDKMKFYCGKALENGKITIESFVGAYLGPYSREYDPQDLYVFKIKTAHDTKIKYINVSIFRDQNYINGFLFSEIPTNKRK